MLLCIRVPTQWAQRKTFLCAAKCTVLMIHEKIPDGHKIYIGGSYCRASGAMQRRRAAFSLAALYCWNNGDFSVTWAI